MLIDVDGYIKITDFGLSKRNITSPNSTYSICGTPEYLAPEVLHKQGHGKPVDLWAFGSFVFEMITGRPPFTNDNRDFLYKQILEEEVSYPKFYVDKTLKSLLEGCLEKQPSMRFSIKDIKQHEWFKGIDWDGLLLKKIKAPFIPLLKADVDVSNFDTVLILFE